jgi:hypothetical protein
MRTTSFLTIPAVLTGLLLTTAPADAQVVRTTGGVQVSVQWRRNAPPVYAPYGDYRRGGYRDFAFDNGFRDGYREGLDAARDRDRYDPVREKRYRQGDRGYDRDYGPRGQYKQSYREGFRTGYDQGYREGRSRDYRGNRGWDRRW